MLNGPEYKMAMIAQMEAVHLFSGMNCSPHLLRLLLMLSANLPTAKANIKA